MLSKAPVAFLCTLMSLDLANLIKGNKAPDLAIFDLLESQVKIGLPWVAKLVIQPTALH